MWVRVIKASKCTGMHQECTEFKAIQRNSLLYMGFVSFADVGINGDAERSQVVPEQDADRTEQITEREMREMRPRIQGGAINPENE